MKNRQVLQKVPKVKKGFKKKFNMYFNTSEEIGMKEK